MPALYDQFFLFGDSITQESFNQERGFGFSAALQHAYIRRLDVINRGFSGYTTRQALKVLDSIIPTPDQARIRFLTIFFGANDASVPEAENKQHVPLEEYKQNLEKIITHPLIKAHDARIILIAPAPIEEHLQWKSDQDNDRKTMSRVAAVTKRYGEAASEVGEKLGVPVVNMWKAFMSRTQFSAETWKEEEPLIGARELPQNEELVSLMHDGLHFSPSGYKILFEEMLKTIEITWPDQLPERLPTVHPGWNNAEEWEAFLASR